MVSLWAYIITLYTIYSVVCVSEYMFKGARSSWEGKCFTGTNFDKSWWECHSSSSLIDFLGYLDCITLMYIEKHLYIDNAHASECSKTSILFRGDIMVDRGVFMIYLHIKKCYIWYRNTRHFLFLYESQKSSHWEIDKILSPFSMTPALLSPWNKTARCRTLPWKLEMKNNFQNIVVSWLY